jgi:uncharacterized protein (TIGR03067 family)
MMDMRVFYTASILAGIFLATLYACDDKTACQELTGEWNDREGHELVFYSDGKGLWLNKFGQMIDTVSFMFTLNCKTRPASIDLQDFSGGPFAGKTLSGIIEWSADSIFRLCYETGGNRPEQFDPEQTIRFFHN